MDIKKGNRTISNEGRCRILFIEYCTDMEREHSFQLTNAVINFLFCVPNVAINLILFTAVWRTSTLRTPSNILICALASTDLFVGLTAQPFYATLMYSLTTNLPLSVKCVLQASSRISANIFGGMSFLTFTAISVDKLLMLHLHLRYNTVVTNKKTICSLVAFLALSAGLAASNVFDAEEYVIKASIIMFVCFIIAIISYTKIYRTVIRHQQEIHDQAMAVATKENDKVLELARFKKRTFSMMWIYGVFILLYLPYICSLVLLRVVDKSCVLLEIRDFAVTLVLLNSLVNPGMICWKMREIRNAMKQLVCFICLKKKINAHSSHAS